MSARLLIVLFLVVVVVVVVAITEYKAFGTAAPPWLGAGTPMAATR